MKQFTNLYPVTRTLRFELIPQGQTLETINGQKLIAADEHRAISFVAVKKMIDRHHKKYIERVLSGFKLQYANEGKLNSIEELYSLYKRPDKTVDEKKDMRHVQDELREQISDAFTKDASYKRLFSKELIREDLLEEASDEEKSLIYEFRNFTTYFSGFHDNRENMYSAENKSTSIAHRIINDNLPKFIDNMGIYFNKIMRTPIAESIPVLYDELKDRLGVGSIDEMFMLDNFNNVMSQKQIDVYNTVIGGLSLENGKRIQGINEYVNLYNQQNGTTIPKLKPLFKQILSDREQLSWVIDKFESDNEMLSAIKECYEYLDSNVFKQIETLIRKLDSFNLEHIYIPVKFLNGISNRMFGEWHTIQDAVIDKLKVEHPKNKRERDDKYDSRIMKMYKSYDSFSIAYLNSCLPFIGPDICSYFSAMGAVDSEDKQEPSIPVRIMNAYHEVSGLLNQGYPEDKRLAQDESSVDKLKSLLDSIKDLQHFIKPLCSQCDEFDKDERFYSEIESLEQEINQITPLYTKVRNRMTSKPYSTDKFKLSFNIKGNLLNGWVDSKTEKSDCGTQYGGYLFRKMNSIGEYDYYLGISANTKLFRKADGVTGQFERLDYYQPKSQTVYGKCYVGKDGYENDKQALMQSIRTFVDAACNEGCSKEIANETNPSAMVSAIRDKFPSLYQELLKDSEFSEVNKRVTDNLHRTILSLSRVPRSKEYKNAKFSLFTEPQQVIEEICKDKVFNYFPIDEQELSDVMASDWKPLLLFKISNKDLSFAEKNEKGLRRLRGTENIHTMYFKALMSGEQSVFDIGSGEVFFRKASLKAKVTHPAGVPMKNKNPLNCNKERVLGYDLIKDKHYTEDKFFFHISLLQNYKAPKKCDVNALTRNFIKNNNDVHFIGIDRGERNLLYVSVINGKGQIVEQSSLNVIESNGNMTDYHDLMDKRENKNKKDKQSWRTIEGIKDLKQGYLSQVVHKIVSLVLKYNAVVVLEDLNMEFKRGRQKVEKSVYQQFEKALIDKFNYIADKHIDSDKVGGILNGLQLANKFEGFNKMGKQNGFIFYIPAWKTSNIDPVTGFVDFLHPRYESVEKSRAFICKFKSIRFNKETGMYEFALDYDDFTDKASGTRTEWTVCSNGTRIENFRNKKNSQWESREVRLTDEFDKLFGKYGISRDGNLKDQIARQTEKGFFEPLMSLIGLMFKIRNCKIGTSIDYVLSPVADESGVFYDSRCCGDRLPKDGDANGAYNIARKGLMMARQIRACSDVNKVKFDTSNEEWLRFVQEKLYAE